MQPVAITVECPFDIFRWDGDAVFLADSSSHIPSGTLLMQQVDILVVGGMMQNTVASLVEKIKNVIRVGYFLRIG